MLEVHCQEHLDNVRIYADSLGPAYRKQLEGKIAWLEHYRDDTCLVHLYQDFAPHSFEFVLLGPEKNGQRERWFNGGLIYHHGAGTGGAPEYCVEIDPQKGPHWNIHT